VSRAAAVMNCPSFDELAEIVRCAMPVDAIRHPFGADAGVLDGPSYASVELFACGVDIMRESGEDRDVLRTRAVHLHRVRREDRAESRDRLPLDVVFGPKRTEVLRTTRSSRSAAAKAISIGCYRAGCGIGSEAW
jgi:hypothetical protein